jgi:hypothetical protein
VTPVLAAAIVDWSALGEVIGVSLVVGVGVTAVFSVAVLGAVRSVDSARDGRPLAAGAYGTLALVAVAGCFAAIVFGIVLMVSK